MFSNTRHVPEEGVVLEHEAHPAVRRRFVRAVATVEEHAAGVRDFQAGDDAQQRGLPAARRAEQRHQLAGLDVQVDVGDGDERAEPLRDALHFDAHRRPLGKRLRRFGPQQGRCRPAEKRLGGQRDQRHERQHRRHGERGREVVLVVQDLDVQRGRVRLAADVPGHDRHRAELADGSRVQQHDAVEQSPADVGERHAPERLPAARAERQRRLLLLGALLLHDGNQLARHERHGDEQRRQDDARHREDDPDAVRGEPGPDEPLRAEQQHEDEARDDRATPRTAGR